MQKRVLVTGSTGFIGKELVPKLNGNNIHLLERYVTGRYSIDEGSGVTVHKASLSDLPAVEEIVKKVQPEIVLHIGAISAVAFSYENYIEVSEVNYLGSVNLAEACRRQVPRLEQFIFAGTSEEYGMTLKSTEERLTEDSPLLPNSPYAVSKVAFDNYLRYMRMAYDFPATVIRPFNTYGRRDNNHFFIERTISQMLAGKEVKLGDPTAVRDWLYVDDHVDGYLKAMGNKDAIGQTIQLCSGVGMTTKETAGKIAERTGFSGRIEWNSTQKRPLDARILIGDNSKALALLRWTPKTDFDAGIQKTIDHWRGMLRKSERVAATAT